MQTPRDNHRENSKAPGTAYILCFSLPAIDNLKACTSWSERKIRIMKKYIWLFAVCLLGFVVGMAASYNQVIVDFFVRPVAAQNELIISVPSEAIDKQDLNPTVPVGIEQVGEEQVVDIERVIENENSKAVDSIRSTWVHIRHLVTFDTDEPNNGVLPNGMAIPHEQINDYWYYVDEKGTITKVVSIMRDVDGNIAQVGVGSHGTSWNSGTDEVEAQEYFQLEGLDGGFLKELRWLKSFGSNPVMQEIKLPNGSNGLKITITDKLDKPVDTISYKVAFIGAETVAIFDSSTGYLWSYESVFHLEDGSKRVFKQYTQEISFLESPSEEVLMYLDKKESRVRE
jgi:hypothetical protein